MTEQERRIIFTVAGGEVKNLPFIHSLHSSPNGIQLLEQCVSSKIVGKSFHEMWVNFQYKRPYVISYLMKKIESDKFRKLQIKDL